jgi:hypothetical protein
MSWLMGHERASQVALVSAPSRELSRFTALTLGASWSSGRFVAVVAPLGLPEMDRPLPPMRYFARANFVNLDLGVETAERGFRTRPFIGLGMVVDRRAPSDPRLYLKAFGAKPRASMEIRPLGRAKDGRSSEPPERRPHPRGPLERDRRRVCARARVRFFLGRPRGPGHHQHEERRNRDLSHGARLSSTWRAKG